MFGEKLTREQAIEFCKDRERMHRLKAEKIIADAGDIEKNDVERLKHNATIDLANKYADIAELLTEGVID